MPADYTAGDPIPRRHHGRQVGESYRDAIDRLAGQLRAAEQDRDQDRAELDRLRAIEKRLEETTSWCGVDQMHRAIEYIRTGSTPEARALLGATDTTPPDRDQQQDDRPHRNTNPQVRPVRISGTATPAEVAAADELTAHDRDAGFYGDGPLTCRCGRAEPCHHCPEET